MRKKALLVTLMVMVCWLPVWGAVQQEVELPWSEISPLIEAQQIALALPDGTYVRGKVIAVQADALEMDVKKTSDKRLHPKGKTTIPRSSISVIELRKMRKFRIGTIAGGVAGVAGGAFLGALAGMGIGGIAGDGMDPLLGAMLGAVVGMAPGAIVGGRVGRNLDRKITLIKIVPDAPATEKLSDPTQTGSEIMRFEDSGFSARNPHAKEGWAF